MWRKELDIFRRSVKFRMPKERPSWKEIARGGSTFTEMRRSRRALFLGSKEEESREDEWEQMVDEQWLRARISVANNLHNHIKAASLGDCWRWGKKKSVDWAKEASIWRKKKGERNERRKWRRNAVAKRRTWSGMGLDSARLRYRNPHSQLSGCAPYGCCTR